MDPGLTIHHRVHEVIGPIFILNKDDYFLNKRNTSEVKSKENRFSIIVFRISTLFFKTGLIHIVCQDTILRVNMSDSLTSLSSTVTDAKD